MDFSLSAEQQMFRDSVRGFARRRLAADAVARAHAPGFAWDVAAMMAGQGLTGITLAGADGGQGGSLMDAVIAIEEVARICPKSADVIQATNFGPIRTFAEYASEAQKARWLPDLLAGKTVISVCMSEPEAGSAATDLTTSATETEGGFLLNGSKVYSTNSPEAAVFLVYCRFGPPGEKGARDIGSVLVPREAEGLTLGKPSRFLTGEDWVQLYFEDCFVPAADVLLPAGGFQKQIQGFNAERIGNAARSLGVAQCAFDLAKAQAESRVQFGRPLMEFQGIQWKFADMAMKLEAARLLLYRAAAGAADGLPDAWDTTIAKAYCNTAGFEVANEALQVMGALGCTEDSLAQYCWRRTRGWMIAGGTVEILKNRIAEHIFDRRFSQRPPRTE